MYLSVIVPAFNEERTIGPLLERLVTVLDAQPTLSYEVIVVDDGSSDDTVASVKRLSHPSISVVRMSINSGKGAAVQRGIREASGRYVLVQDADLEYFPEDIPLLLPSTMQDETRSVYGSRVKGAHDHVPSWRGKLGLWPGQGIPQRLANSVLAAVVKRRHGVKISDPLTGYKLYPRGLFSSWTPATTGFETDHEITLRLIELGIEIEEVPVRYVPRSKAEGKKIRAIDFVRALRVFTRSSAS